MPNRETERAVTEIDRLTKRYGKVTALDSLSFTVWQGIPLTITEEFRVKNIINIFISPISMAKLLSAICVAGVIKSLVTTIMLGFLAFFFYKFSLLVVGFYLAPFIGSLLLFGWAVGLVHHGVDIPLWQGCRGCYPGGAVSDSAGVRRVLPGFGFTDLAAENSLSPAFNLYFRGHASGA